MDSRAGESEFPGTQQFLGGGPDFSQYGPAGTSQPAGGASAGSISNDGASFTVSYGYGSGGYFENGYGVDLQ